MDFGCRNVENQRICCCIVTQSLHWSCCIERRAARPSEEPVLMIRATSSRSTRPNHMSNPIDSPKAPGPANFGRVVGELHSVTKQAPFRISFQVHFGGQKPLKIDEISSFWALYFPSSFRAANLMISGGSRSWKTLILLSNNRVFRKINFPPTGTFFGRFSTPKLLQNPLNLASKR